MTATISAESIEVGTELEPKVFGPITATHIVRYAGASGDFNPIHHDDAFAKSAGYPGVFSIGMLHAAFLGGYVADWLGPRNLRRINVLFAEQVWPGDELTCSAKVCDVKTVDGDMHVGLDIICTRQTGAAAVTGRAEFVLTNAGKVR